MTAVGAEGEGSPHVRVLGPHLSVKREHKPFLRARACVRQVSRIRAEDRKGDELEERAGASLLHEGHAPVERPRIDEPSAARAEGRKASGPEGGGGYPVP